MWLCLWFKAAVVFVFIQRMYMHACGDYTNVKVDMDDIPDATLKFAIEKVSKPPK